MIAYLLSKVTNGSLNPVAICGSEENAKDRAIDGQYLIAPVTVDEIYETLLSDGFTGAIFYVKEGVSTKVNQAKQDIENLNAHVLALTEQLGNFKTLALSRLSQIQSALETLDERVTDLENEGPPEPDPPKKG